MIRQILSSIGQRSISTQLLRLQAFATATTTAGPSGGSPSGPNQGEAMLNNADVPIVDYKDPDYLPLPEYPRKQNEPLEVQKQRLIYQSRKRGMLENDLLLSTFAHKYLSDMDAKMTEQYDQLINGVTNDWDIYYWATGAKPTPPEHDNEIMHKLQEHVQNSEKEPRYQQPNL